MVFLRTGLKTKQKWSWSVWVYRLALLLLKLTTNMVHDLWEMYYFSLTWIANLTKYFRVILFSKILKIPFFQSNLLQIFCLKFKNTARIYITEIFYAIKLTRGMSVLFSKAVPYPFLSIWISRVCWTHFKSGKSQSMIYKL